MTIPLDNLYNYIHGLFPEPVCVYLFYPHGSKNILNLIGIAPFNKFEGVVLPQVICNDQEPLNYNLYKNFSQSEIEEIFKKQYNVNYCYNGDKNIINKNLKFALGVNIHDNPILIHSEKNSNDLEQYKNDGYIDVYYWCHAIIAKDWYRFSEFDVRLTSSALPYKDFLIYCRDWSGLREYRIKFQELLYLNNLTMSSITNIKQVNSDGHTIDEFIFKNQKFAPENFDFFYQLADNSVNPEISANYCPNDFISTYISVVLETVFDGQTIHLTEKILRPIACGHPFILAAGPGSLEYLRSYGFKTFSPYIDESYDLEPDSFKRLEKIIQSMKAFSQLTVNEKNKVHKRIKKIADFNKKWFFSKEFVTLIESELKENIQQAISEVKKTRSYGYRQIKKHKTKPFNKQERKIIANYIKELRKINRYEQ
jgi:ribosomal protein S13